MRFFVNICFAVLFIVHPLFAAEKNPVTNDWAKGSVIKTYKTIEQGDDLKLFIFNPSAHNASAEKPAIVFFFGGGWVGGTPDQFAMQSKYLAARGIVAICAEYRTKKSHKTTPFECVKDAKSCIRWVRENANDLGIDPDRVIAAGGSAGGHIAAATAALKDFDEDRNISVSCKPDALVLFNPVFDNGPSGYGYNRVKEKYKDFSPIHNITKGLPPTLVILGTKDQLIPVKTAEKFKALAEKVNSRCDLKLYRDQKHGFFNYSKNKEMYFKTLTDMDNFLVSLGYLPEKNSNQMRTDVNVKTLYRDFQSPPDWAKPSGYWWWLNANVDKEAITRDLEQFKEKGMSAVLLVSSGQWGGRMPVKGPEFLSDEWIDLYKHALKEAHRLGIEVDVNIAPGWNMGGPWITPEKSCRWFLQSQTTIQGPQKFSGKLPFPAPTEDYNSKPHLGVRHSMSLPFEKVDYRDTAIVAFRTPKNTQGPLGPNKRPDLAAKSNRVDANCFKPVVEIMSQTLSPWKSSKDDQPVNPEDVIDLTGRLKKDGTLQWDVPPGKWTVVRTGHRMTGAQLSVPMPGQGGLENDYLDRAGVELMFEKTGKILAHAAGPLTGNTLRAYCSDSFECGYPNWTANMLEHFKKYRGYDPAPYLPVLKGWIIGSAEMSERFLYDYRRTVADCMADEHYGRFTELSRQYGLMTRCESAGPSWSSTMCMDGLKNLGRVDFPQGEFWRNGWFQQDGENMVGKQTASAAHIYGKRTASAEAFTLGGHHWTGSPDNLKPVADKAFCDGINCFVFHTTTCQRPADGKPGYEYGAGTHFNPNVTWWNQAAGPWVSYINRCQTLLQSGLFVADVLYYNGDWAPNLVGPRNIAHNPGKGYDYDVCNTEVLLTRTSVKNGKIVLPDGMSYRLLVLPDSDRMPVKVIKKIESLVKAGATVIGPKPESAPGLENYPQCDITVQKTAKTLWADIDGKNITQNKTGKGRVIFGKTPEQVLLNDGVKPDIEVSGQQDTHIDFIHRATPDTDFYFLANRNDRPENVTVTFRQNSRQPELWNPVTGEKRDLPEYTLKDGRTSIHLQFDPHGSMFIVFTKPAEKISGKNFAKFETLQTVTGPWKVQFDEQWFYPVNNLTCGRTTGTFVFGNLIDWTEHPDPAVRYFSGTAYYQAKFSFDEDLKNRKYLLDLGRVNISAAVSLNGYDLGVVWCDPWQIDITEVLKKGDNRLEIEVVNLWPNRLIGDGKLPEDQRKTRTNIKHYYRKPRNGSDHKLLPSGLLGPVQILIEQSAK